VFGSRTWPHGEGNAADAFERICVLRGALHDATQAFLDVLDGYTLADLIKPRKALSSLLLLDQLAARAP
jgi:DNA-binding IscR family transcriptional regulator